ncbi:MAG: hypothetical protein KDJ29_08665 [Hyphomicrobiales bacterium]|nr:hypothetical protein [Hyphomicrobiales bacterium]
MNGKKVKRGGTESEVSREDLASDIMGKNSLQGNDQESVRNQRQAVPDVKQETDGVVESFEKLDKDVRAREDLGKGNRHSSEHPFRKA